MNVDERKILLHQQLGGRIDRLPASSGAPLRSTAERIELPRMGHVLASLRTEVGPLHLPRAEKVAGLRAVMAKGNYSADLQDVARKFLRELLEQLLA